MKNLNLCNVFNKIDTDEKKMVAYLAIALGATSTMKDLETMSAEDISVAASKIADEVNEIHYVDIPMLRDKIKKVINLKNNFLTNINFDSRATTWVTIFGIGDYFSAEELELVTDHHKLFVLMYTNYLAKDD